MRSGANPVANPAVISELLDGEAVLVNTDTAAAIVLNSTGLAAWELMDGSHSLDDIVACHGRIMRPFYPAAAANLRPSRARHWHHGGS
jgi:hypothetical protein